jgi:flagellar hook-length control protein FliK
MAGLVPIQVGNATNGQAGALASSAGSATGFAAVFSGVFNPGNGPKTGSLDPASGVERSTSVAMSSDLWPILPLDGSDTRSSAGVKSSGSSQSDGGDEVSLPAKSSAAGLLRPILGGATTSPTTSSLNGTAQDLRGVLTPQPGPAGSVGEATPDNNALEPVRSEGNAQTPPVDAGSVTALLLEPGVESPLGNVIDEGLHGKTAERHLMATVSGKDSDIAGGNHTKGHRLSDEAAVPSIQAGVSQGVPDPGSITLALVSQPPAGPASVPPPSSGTAGATAPQVKAAGGGKLADSHRPGPAEPGKSQSGSTDHAAEATLLSAASSIASDQEKTVTRSDAVLETPTLTMRAELPQSSPSGAAASVPMSRDHERPAAPADQIAPAVVGILQKPDGQQSVTVRLQPAELGQVQIRVDQTVAGAAHIAITAERPETLQLLQRDEPRLQQVLDQAGMQSTGRTISFQVSTPEQVGAAAARPDSMQTGGGAFGQGQSGGAWRQNGDTPNDFGRNPDPEQGQNQPRWFRAGLDITA